MVGLKFLHIVGLTIWVAGLLYLPAMLWAHQKVRDQQDFARVRMASRMVYMGIVSPAAFIAVGAGAALLLVTDALYPWMFVKLVFVGGLVIIHIQYEHVLTRLADEETKGPTVRVKLLALGVLLASAVIMTLVLAKPAIPTGFLPDWAHEPGLLRPSEGREPVPPPLPPVSSSPSLRPRS